MFSLSRILAVVGLLALADAAFASAHDPMLVLGYVAGAFIVTALGTAVLWTRPLVAAVLGWMWLTAAFAAGAFAAGGVDATGAPVFTSLSGGDAAALIVSVATALAALGSVLAIHSGAARTVIVALAAYIVLPMAASLGHGGLTAALTSGPFAVSRGAYAGAEILLPLAALAALVFALVYVATKRGLRSAIALISGIALLGATQLSAYTAGSAQLPTIVAFEHPQADDLLSPLRGVTEPPLLKSAQLDRIMQTMDPKDYMLPLRAHQLSTVGAAFAYVRDDIRFESYSGILRGAQGTFHARAGNALDRAMLLAAILETNEVPVRIVSGHLPTPEAERLFDRIFETGPATTAPPQSISSDAGGLRKRIFARAHRDYDAILSALGNAVPAVTPESHENLIKEIEQHAWLQAKVNGKWVDLDTSFRDSTVGHAYAAVEQTYNGAPVPLMQNVTIRVTIETLTGGVLTKDVALEKMVPAYKLIDNNVYLAHLRSGLEGLFAKKDVLQPVLSIDGDVTAGKPISFGAGASPAGAAAPNPVQQAVDAFGTQASATPNPSDSSFVAEWLDFEIAFPDGRKDVTRRVLVDRAGTAWRQAATLDPAKLKDLARNADGLIAPQMLYNIWFSAGKHDLLAFANSAQRLLEGTIPSNDPKSPTFEEQAWPLAMRDLSWFIASDHVFAPSLNDTPGVRFYADSPRIFMWSIGPDPSGRSKSTYFESDMRRDKLRGVAKDPSGQAATIAQHKLWFGALEGALEQEMSAPPFSSAANSLVTTSSLSDSGTAVAIGPGASSTVSASDPETQARLHVALAGGDTLVVPKRVLAGGMSGWWQISRDTGDMRAVLGEDLDGGLGIIGQGTGAANASYGNGVCTVLCDDNLNPYGYGKKPPTKGTGGGEIGEYAFNVVYISAAAVPSVKLVLGAVILAEAATIAVFAAG